MGAADTITKSYMQKNHIFADVFNYFIYDGESVIDPEQLQELDTTEMALPFSLTNEETKMVEKVTGKDSAVQKYRDILKSIIIKYDAEAAYILLGVENQTKIHYAMPVRNAIYDALQYGKQVADIAARHRKKKELFTAEEYLSGFKKTDKIIPVITLVIHFGAEPWDGPMSLHEMMDVHDKKLLNLVQNYQIHLIDPSAMSEKELEKFTSSLREVLSFIKYSEDPDKLASYVEDNPRMNLEREAAMVIKAVTSVPVNLPDQKEDVNMCKAIEIMLSNSKNEGIIKGRIEGLNEGKMVTLAKVVSMGKLTVTDAAELAGMTEEEFLKSCEKFKQELC